MKEKDYYSLNKEKIIQRQKEYYQKNKEKRLAYQKEWSDRNKDYMVEYRKSNKERLCELAKKHYWKNKVEKLFFCKICGKQIIGLGGKKYCDICKIEKQKEWARKCNKRIRKEKQVCKLCGVSTKSRQKLCEICNYKILQQKLINKNIIKTKKKEKAIIQQKFRKKLDKRFFSTTPAGRVAIKRTRHNRRAREKNVSHSFTSKEWTGLLAETNGICPVCNKFVGIDNMSMDHIIPLSRIPNGFVYEIGHIQPMCHYCNSCKKDYV